MIFDRHGIDHLSPASLNLWMANPREWAVRYLAREAEDAAGPAMWRGTAVEMGLARRLCGGSIEQARAATCDSFELNAVGDLSNEVEAERRLAMSMLNRACSWTAPGEFIGAQLRVEHWFDDVQVPLIGYVDFAFSRDIDVDLKTTRACPAKPRGNHVAKQTASLASTAGPEKPLICVASVKSRARLGKTGERDGASLTSRRFELSFLPATIASRGKVSALATA